jgi:hypothetical protein
MDANTYYLNQYLDEQEAAVRRYENSREAVAQALIENPQSKFYPWTEDNVFEALGEAPASVFSGMAKAHGNDKELANIVREAVVGYWYETALESCK